MNEPINELEQQMQAIEQQEAELQFEAFTDKTALELGLIMVENAKKHDWICTIDISRHGLQMFHYAFDGRQPDGDDWIIRKNRVVNRFYHSSLYLYLYLKNMDVTLDDFFHVSSMEYAAAGGGFPLIIKNVGVVGTVTVSGLAPEEDHELVTSSIRQYLNSL